MSEEIPSEDKVQVASSEEQVRKLFSEKLLNLDESEQSLLSKVLFPETHQNSVVLAGVKRTLRPLSLKASRLLFTTLKPFALKQQEIINSPTPVDISEDLLVALKASVKILADFYKWEGVSALIEEEELSISEMQAVVLAQEQIDGANNFLLGGLRVLVSVMRLNEVISLRFLSMLTMPSSAKSSTAALKSS